MYDKHVSDQIRYIHMYMQVANRDRVAQGPQKIRGKEFVITYDMI